MGKSRFSGIENAKVSEKLPYIEPGTYLFEVEACKVIESRKGDDFWVTEFKVLEAVGEGANPVGSQCSHMIKLANDSALGNIKAFLAALGNQHPDTITPADADSVVADENPAKGTKVRAEAFVTQTKKGDDFTVVRYSAYDEKAATKSA